MKRSKSISYPNPTTNRSKFMADYDTKYDPLWPYSRRLDFSPPPPYSSRETSQSSSKMVPTAPTFEPVVRSQQRHTKKDQTVSSEITPLLEDFTRKFVDSQISIPNSQQMNGSTSQHVPPELLVLCQQQAPYNPNFDDSFSTNSSNSSITMSQCSHRNSFEQSKFCGLFSTTHYRWFVGNFILLVSLMSFNIGMNLSPSIYSTILLQPITQTNVTNSNSAPIIDLFVSTLFQTILALMVGVSSLMLLYSACKVVINLRKRFQQSIKYRIHMSNRTSLPWFFITYERIVYETLGSFFARTLSLLLFIYLFGLSTIYVLILSDYLNIFMSLLPYGGISNLFCETKVWYLNHNVVITVWLSAIVLIAFGFSSFCRNKYSSSLIWLKILITFIGFISVIYLIFTIVYTFVDVQSSQDDDGDDVVGKNSNTDFNFNLNWNNIEQKGIMLFSSVPLLIMPFHLNEFLITLLFAPKRKHLNQERLLTTSTMASRNQTSTIFSRSNPTIPTSSTNQRRDSDVISEAISSNNRKRAPLRDHDETHWEHLEHVVLDDTTIADVANNPMMMEENHTNLKSLSNFFDSPSLSFSSVRNLYLLVTFIVLLLNTVFNSFAYLLTTNMDSHFNESRQEFETKSKRLVFSVDLNYLQDYLHKIEVNQSNEDNQSWQQTLLLIAVGALLLKITFVYLLLTFRGILAHQTLTSNNKPKNLLYYSQDQHEFAMLYITFPNEMEAKKIAKQLVEQSMANFVNVMPVMSTFYRENNSQKIEVDTESLLMAKILSKKASSIIEHVTMNHPYELAEIYAVPILQLNKPLTDCLKSNLK
ncbi:hypothetical protein RDWZM_007657 [Blomia tropicalis]|uniref:Uncharacterized protein n=1 Tax=Blomia tropicalis TaxID=40697 RepID=A0A9Q0M2V8_BLOTA|nr:hypothetical protein RDWZM_007657 [Blomia tropicalis]